jgi:hypothetical protein
MSRLSARVKANRLNAQKSTGPITEEGKAISSQNATTHGLFCRDMLVKGEDPVELVQIKDGLLRSLAPRDMQELLLAEQIIGFHWKLRRLRSAETEAYEDQAQIMKTELWQFRAAQEKDPKARAVPEPAAGLVMWRMLEDVKDPTLERLSRYEQRLLNCLNRCMKQLHSLQQRELVGFLPQATDDALAEPLPAEANAQNEANPEAPATNLQCEKRLYRTLRDYRRCARLEADMEKAYMRGRTPEQASRDWLRALSIEAHGKDLFAEDEKERLAEENTSPKTAA